MKLVLRAVDAACLAAIATAVLDMGAPLWAGRLGLGAFLAGTALLVALALGVALVAAGLGALAPRVDAAVSRRRWLLPAAAAVVLGIPLLEAVVRTAARPGLTLAILLGALAVVAASAYRLAARAPSPARWLAGAVAEDPQAARRSGRARRWRGRMTTQRSREYSGAKPLAQAIARADGNCPQREVEG